MAVININSSAHETAEKIVGARMCIAAFSSKQSCQGFGGRLRPSLNCLVFQEELVHKHRSSKNNGHVRKEKLRVGREHLPKHLFTQPTALFNAGTKYKQMTRGNISFQPAIIGMAPM